MSPPSTARPGEMAEPDNPTRPDNPTPPENSARPATGTLSYGLGFLALIPIPVIGIIVAGLAMAGQYAGQMAKGRIAADNGRRAANWGFTLLCGLVLVLVLMPVLVAVDGANHRPASLPLVPIVLYLMLGILHLVVVVWGVVVARRGGVFQNRLAIPFFRHRVADSATPPGVSHPAAASRVSGPRRRQLARQGPILSLAVVVVSLIWVVCDLLVFPVILSIGSIQGTIPFESTSLSRAFYTAAPGYPSFHLPLALYLGSALVWAAFPILAIRPERRSGFFIPQHLLWQGLIWAMGDLVVSLSFTGDPGWPHLAWIAAIIRVAAAAILAVAVLRQRAARIRRQGRRRR